MNENLNTIRNKYWKSDSGGLMIEVTSMLDDSAVCRVYTLYGDFSVHHKMKYFTEEVQNLTRISHEEFVQFLLER